jgi:hypothetical protein
MAVVLTVEQILDPLAIRVDGPLRRTPGDRRLWTIGGLRAENAPTPGRFRLA